MKRLWFLFAAVAMLAIVVQHREVSRLRVDNKKLGGMRDEAALLAQQNRAIDQLHSENLEIPRLREENQDLYKLRNEVHQLREQKRGLAALRAENQRLVSAATNSANQRVAASATPVSLKENLSDAGFGSPEATIQTLFWALREKNLARFRQAFVPDIEQKLATLSEAGFQENAASTMKHIKDYRIAAKKIVSAEEVLLGLQLDTNNEQKSDVSKAALSFKRSGNEWKLSSPCFY